MGLFTIPILGAIGNIASSLLDRKSAKDQARVSASDNADIRRQDRHWFKQDRKSERDYAQDMTTLDRRYAEKLRDDERSYASRVLVDERLYDEKKRSADRRYAREALASDRDYMAGQLKDQRGYDQQMYNRDVSRYDADRDLMQNRANELAEKTTASRGINFTKMRDDAIAAGYNPMTALSMAHAYSTQVDYSVQGGVYSPGANYTTNNAPYSPVGGGGGGSGGSVGGGGAAPGAVMGSHLPAGGSFSSAGGGYQSQFNPALSSGSFIKEAVDRSLDAWSNRPVEKDPLADALRRAFDQDEMAQQVRDSNIPAGFGYDLTRQKQYQPEATVGVPALSSGKSSVAPARMPSGLIEVGGRKYVPVTKPNGKPGRLEASVAARLDIKPFDTVSPGDWAEIVGEIGEVESTIDNPAIRRNITDEWHMGVPIGQGIRDYFKSGITGNQHIPQSRLGEFPGAW